MTWDQYYTLWTLCTGRYIACMYVYYTHIYIYTHIHLGQLRAGQLHLRSTRHSRRRSSFGWPPSPRRWIASTWWRSHAPRDSPATCGSCCGLMAESWEILKHEAFHVNFMGKSLIFQCLNGGKTEKKPSSGAPHCLCPVFHSPLDQR